MRLIDKDVFVPTWHWIYW